MDETTRKSRTYIQEQRTDDELQPLTVPNIVIIDRIRLDDVEQVLLPDALHFLEVLVLWEGPTQISDDVLLVRRGLFEKLGVDGLQFGVLG